MRRKNEEFTPIGSVVTRLLKDLRETQSEQTQELQALWRETVGPALADVSRVCGLGSGTVNVEAQGSAVLSELRQFYRDPFLKRVREKGMMNVRDVSFRLADELNDERE